MSKYKITNPDGTETRFDKLPYSRIYVGMGYQSALDNGRLFYVANGPALIPMKRMDGADLMLTSDIAIALAHHAITREKGSHYAPTADEMNEYLVREVFKPTYTLAQFIDADVDERNAMLSVNKYESDIDCSVMTGFFTGVPTKEQIPTLQFSNNAPNCGHEHDCCGCVSHVASTYECISNVYTKITKTYTYNY
jgi:hypothetical protein